MTKLERLAELLEKHERIFYLVVSALAVAFAFGAVLLGGKESLFAQSMSALLLNISAALLVLAMVYWLRSVFFVHRDRIEIESWMNDINERLDRLGADSSLGRSFETPRDYYEAYYDQVSSASESVLMVGDGFACHNGENRERAFGLYEAMKTALENGASLKRFQYNNTLSLEWLSLLIQLKGRFQERFQLLMKQEYDPSVVPFILCIADHGYPSASVNIMFTVSSDSTLGEKVGGPGFVFKEAKNLEGTVLQAFEDYFDMKWSQSERDLRDLWVRLEAERRELVNSALDEGKVDAGLDQTSLYRIGHALNILDIGLIHEEVVASLLRTGRLNFAYGSNLLSERIGGRIKSAYFVGAASLRDYDLRFNILGNRGEGKGGGIGNIVSSPGVDVQGSLYWMNEDDFHKLAKIESEMGYNVQQIEVVLSTNRSVMAEVFVGEGDDHEYRPTELYWRLVERGLNERQMTQEYKSRLKGRLFDLQANGSD